MNEKFAQELSTERLQRREGGEVNNRLGKVRNLVRKSELDNLKEAHCNALSRFSPYGSAACHRFFLQFRVQYLKYAVK